MIFSAHALQLFPAMGCCSYRSMIGRAGRPTLPASSRLHGLWLVSLVLAALAGGAEGGLTWRYVKDGRLRSYSASRANGLTEIIGGETTNHYTENTRNATSNMTVDFVLQAEPTDGEVLVGTPVLSSFACSPADTCNTDGSLNTPSFFLYDDTLQVLYSTHDLDWDTFDTIEGQIRVTTGAAYYDFKFKFLLTDVNDNHPVFNQTVYSASIVEGTYATEVDKVVLRALDVDQKRVDDRELGTEFHAVNGQLLDTGNGYVTYAIVDGNPGWESFFELQDRRAVELDLTVSDDYNFVNIVSKPALFDSEHLRQYNLTVRASDNPAANGVGALWTDVSVLINILDVNDNLPIFSQPAGYVLDLLEHAESGTEITGIAITDEDMTLNREIGCIITSDSSGGHFTIYATQQTDGSSTCTLVSTREAAALDREVYTSFILTVLAFDHGMPPLNESVSVTITVTDRNDNFPEINSTGISHVLPEDWSADQIIEVITSTDADIGVNGQVTYLLVNADTTLHTGPFEVVTSAGGVGTLRLGPDGLDYDNGGQQSYSFFLNASNVNANPVLYVSIPVTISVTDVNDNNPEFVLSEYRVSWPEDTAINTVVATVQATDDDSAQNGVPGLMYSVTSSTDGAFAVNSTTGAVSITQVIDYETHSVYEANISVRDSGSPPLFSEVNTIVVLMVDDVNDNTPVFVAPETYTVSVVENLAPGTSIMSVSATDEDTAANRGELIYNISSAGNHNDIFQIDSGTGEITTANGLLNREEFDSFTLTVTVRDNGLSPRSSSTTVNVSVLDENDVTPSFDADSYTANVAENSGRTHLFQVTASDDDLDENGTIAFSIIAGNILDAFEIDATSGDVYSKASAMDRETTRSYTITITASDTATVPLQATVNATINVLDMNDNYPALVSIADENIFENDAPFVFESATCNDLDLADNGTIGFALTSTHGARFAIDATSGAISTGAQLNREHQDTWLIEVVCSDEGAPPLSVTTNFTVTVFDRNDNNPMFTGVPYAADVIENSVVGTFVMQASASDEDINANGVVKFAITAVSPTEQVFAIDEDSGIITVAAGFDRERYAAYTMSVLAFDTGSPELNATVTVDVTVLDVNDNHPRVISATNATTVDENTADGTVVLDVNADDADIGPALTYTMASQSPVDRFSVDSITGEVRVNGDLDREQHDDYTVVVTITDNGSPSLSSNVTLRIGINDINDNDPVLAEIDIGQLYENEVPHVFATAVCSDLDLADNGTIGFTLDDDHDGTFQIDSVTGSISNSRLLDRETRGSWDIEIVCSDEGSPPRSVRRGVVVTVLDRNDNPPVFSSSIYTVLGEVAEDAPVGTPITRVFAQDQDQGTNSQIVFSITAGNPHGQFTVDPDGTVSVSAALDYDTMISYNLTVFASDLGASSRNATTYVVITVGDTNDSPPVFGSTSPESIVIDENIPSGTFLGNFSATDADSGFNGQIVYSVVEASGILINGDGYTFRIDAYGALFTDSDNLDYETIPTDASTTDIPRSIELTVTARDLGIRPKTVIMNVTLHVNNLNDIAPVFTMGTQYAIVEEVAPAIYVTTMSAVDGDGLAFAPMAYTIVGGNTGGSFTLDSSTGVLTSSVRLDREVRTSYTLAIKVVDSVDLRGSSSFFITQVTVDVLDINDNVPIFAAPSYSGIYYSDGSTSTFLRVSASDLDFGENQTIVYSVTGCADVGISSAGDLYSTVPLSSLPKMVSCTAVATDQGVPENAAQVPVGLFFNAAPVVNSTCTYIADANAIASDHAPTVNVQSLLSVAGHDIDGDELTLDVVAAYPATSYWATLLDVAGGAISELPTPPSGYVFNSNNLLPASHTIRFPTSATYHGLAMLQFRIAESSGFDHLNGITGFDPETSWTVQAPYSSDITTVVGVVMPELIAPPLSTVGASAIGTLNSVYEDATGGESGTSIKDMLPAWSMVSVAEDNEIATADTNLCIGALPADVVTEYNAIIIEYNRIAAHRRVLIESGGGPGIAVVSTGSSSGTWVYSISTNPISWRAIPASVDAQTALLLSHDSVLLYRSDVDATDAATIQFHLWDGVDANSGDFAQLNFTNGRFGLDILTANAVTTALNDRPSISVESATLPVTIPYAFAEDTPYTGRLRIASPITVQAFLQDRNRLETTMSLLLRLNVTILPRLSSTMNDIFLQARYLENGTLVHASALNSTWANNIDFLVDFMSDTAFALDANSEVHVATSLMGFDPSCGSSFDVLQSIVMGAHEAGADGAPRNSGSSVSSLLTVIGGIDVDPGTELGLAITHAPDTVLGLWQHRHPGSTLWHEVPRNCSVHAAFILRGDMFLRFSPYSEARWANPSTETSIQVKAHDHSTVDSPTQRWLDVSGNAESSSHSALTATVYVHRGESDDGAAICAPCAGDESVDACGVCGGDGVSCSGCDGIPFSGLEFDDCAVCNGFGNKDCAGDCFGSAGNDDCGQCSGGASGVAPNSLKDCAGFCRGNATVDNCNTCVSDLAAFNGDMDCNNFCGGISSTDDCGVCQHPDAAVTYRDCSGTCFGAAQVDVCGACVLTGGQFNAGMDSCGVCGGDGSTCVDCHNVSAGGATFDACNVCGGDSTSCASQIFSIFPDTGPSVGNTSIFVSGANFDGELYLQLRRAASSGGIIALYSELQCTMISTTELDCVSPLFDTTFHDAPVDGTFAVELVRDKNAASGLSPPCRLDTGGYTFFNRNSISVTRVTPNATTTGAPIAVTLYGTGFPAGMGNISCFVPEVSSLVPAQYAADGGVHCTLPPIGSSMVVSVALAVNGVGNDVLNGSSVMPNLYQSVAVYAPAAHVLRAAFMSSFDVIDFEWNIPIHESSSLGCADIFDASAVETLGSSSSCTFISAQTLRILVGANATVFPGTQLEVKADSVYVAAEELSIAAFGAITVTLPAQLVMPSAHIHGPGSIPRCGALILTTAYTIGGGSFGLEYRWSVLVEDPATPGVAHLRTLLSNVNRYSRELRLDTDLFADGIAYTFTLQATDALQHQSETTYTVQKAPDAHQPVINIRAPTIINWVADGTALAIAATVATSNCDSSPAPTSLAWSVDRCVDASDDRCVLVETAGATLDESSRRASTLVVAQGQYDVGSRYRFTLAARASTSMTTATAAVFVDIIAPTYTCTVAGGSKTVSADTGLVMSVMFTPSVAPDAYFWTCATQSGRPCFLAGTTTVFTPPSALEIDVRGLEPNTYTLTATAYVGSASTVQCRASVELTTQQDAPNVTVSVGTVLADDESVVKAILSTTSSSYDVGWACDVAAAAISDGCVDLRQAQAWACPNDAASTASCAGLDPARVARQRLPINASGVAIWLRLPAGLLTAGVAYPLTLTITDPVTGISSVASVALSPPMNISLTMQQADAATQILSSGFTTTSFLAASPSEIAGRTKYYFRLTFGNTSIALTELVAYGGLSTALPSAVARHPTSIETSIEAVVVTSDGAVTSVRQPITDLTDPVNPDFSAQQLSRSCTAELQFHSDWSSSVRCHTIVMLQINAGAAVTESVASSVKGEAATSLAAVVGQLSSGMLPLSAHTFGRLLSVLHAIISAGTHNYVISPSTAQDVAASLSSLFAAVTTSSIGRRRAISGPPTSLDPAMARQVVDTLEALWQQPSLVHPTHDHLIHPTLERTASMLANHLYASQGPASAVTSHVKVFATKAITPTQTMLSANGLTLSLSRPELQPRCVSGAAPLSELAAVFEVAPLSTVISLNGERYRAVSGIISARMSCQHASSTSASTMSVTALVTTTELSSELRCLVRTSWDAAWAISPGGAPAPGVAYGLYSCPIGSYGAAEIILVVLLPPITVMPTPAPTLLNAPVTAAPATAQPSQTTLPPYEFIPATRSPTLAPTTSAPTIVKAPDGSTGNGAEDSTGAYVWVPIAVIAALVITALVFGAVRGSSGHTRISPKSLFKEKAEEYQLCFLIGDELPASFAAMVTLPSSITLADARVDVAAAVNIGPDSFDYMNSGGGQIERSQEAILRAGSISQTGAKARQSVAFVSVTDGASASSPVIALRMVDGSDPEKHAVHAVSTWTKDAVAEGNDDTTSSASETEDEHLKEGVTPIITRKPIPIKITNHGSQAAPPAVRQPLQMHPRPSVGAGQQKPQLPPIRSVVDLPGLPVPDAVA